MTLSRIAIAAPLVLLAACQSAGSEPAAAPSPDTATATITTAAAPAPTASSAPSAPSEEISLVGTEPFWGGTIAGTQLTYKTPENQTGVTVTVARFAGLNGVSYSGSLDGRIFDLVLTQATCSDGMSDRSYPLTAILRFPDETRSGCAWSASRPFAGPANP